MPTRVEFRRAPQYKRKSNRPNRDDKALKCLFYIDMSFDCYRKIGFNKIFFCSSQKAFKK